jgi:hypothetical protein
MNQPWLTMSDCPVRAFELNAAKKTAASATSSTVVNSPSTVSFITFLMRRNDLDAGIADEYVKSVEFLDYLGCTGIHLLFVGNIHGNPDGAIPGGVDLSGGGIGRLLIEVGDAYLRAFARK